MATSPDLPDNARALPSPLKISLSPFCSVQNVELQTLSIDIDFERGESISELADFIFVDLPENVRLMQNDQNSSHDGLPTDDMKAMEKLYGKY